MAATVTKQELIELGLDGPSASEIESNFNRATRSRRDDALGESWTAFAEQRLLPNLPFEAHVLLRNRFFGCERPPLWYPSAETIDTLNVAAFMKSLEPTPTAQRQTRSVEEWREEFGELQQMACRDPEYFWRRVIDFMGIRFVTDPERILCHGTTEDQIVWFQGCRLNAADLALNRIAESERAIIWADEDRPRELCTMSGSQLRSLSYRIASALAAKCPPGTSVAVYLPMTAVSVAMYLGIVLAGCVVVSIADSFATPEVKTRLRIADTKLVFTQDVTRRGGRIYDLYKKVAGSTEAACVVLPEDLRTLKSPLAQGDLSFSAFLEGERDPDFKAVPCDAYHPSNVLFSSGTTGTPKAIPWTHLTPLKCGVDGMFCQNISSSSIVCWPTSLGWMMGPWLLYAAYLNGAPIALFQGSPTTPAFCKFVETAGVTMLGVIPSIVRAWKENNTAQTRVPAEGCDWRRVQCFSSTGEASSYDEYHWLMAQARYKPVIEYCGGTEIGGAYISSYMVYPQTPSGFTAPVLGTSVVCLAGGRVRDIAEADGFEGELAVVPPAFGLSQTLLNKNHVEVYYQGMPRHGEHGYRLRRHGDAFLKSNGFYFSRGRCDDTMNLGGIKVSCVELEYAVMRELKEVKEAAAVGFAPGGGGPEELALFLVLDSGTPVDPESLKSACQRAIKQGVNPLFKVSRVYVRDALPRTSSNKVTRNVLRDEVSRGA